MGNISSIRVHADSPSIAEPGEKSCISDPISRDLVDDPQEFFSELVEMIRDPVNYLLLEHYFMKELIYKEEDPDHYSVRVIFDGKKVKKVFPQRENDNDVCGKWKSVAVDRALMHMKTVEFEPEKDTEVAKVTTHTRFHVDKEKRLVVEVWAFGPEGERRSGGMVAWISDYFHLKPLLVPRIARSVKVHSNIEMAETGGRSALSEPLDDYFSADGFFEALVTQMKQEALDKKAEMQHTSDWEFSATWPLIIPTGEAGETVTLRFSRDTVADPKNLSIVAHDRTEDELTLTFFWRITRDPVRCELWQILPNGSRAGGGHQAYILRLTLMNMINAEKLREQVEALQQDDNNFML